MSGYHGRAHLSLLFLIALVFTVGNCINRKYNGHTQSHRPYPMRDPRMSTQVNKCSGPRFCIKKPNGNPPDKSGCSTCCKQNKYQYGGGCQMELFLPENEYGYACLCYDNQLPDSYIKAKGLTKGNPGKNEVKGTRSRSPSPGKKH